MTRPTPNAAYKAHAPGPSSDRRHPERQKPCPYSKIVAQTVLRRVTARAARERRVNRVRRSARDRQGWGWAMASGHERTHQDEKASKSPQWPLGSKGVPRYPAAREDGRSAPRRAVRKAGRAEGNNGRARARERRACGVLIRQPAGSSTAGVPKDSSTIDSTSHLLHRCCSVNVMSMSVT